MSRHRSRQRRATERALDRAIAARFGDMLPANVTPLDRALSRPATLRDIVEANLALSVRKPSQRSGQQPGLAPWGTPPVDQYGRPDSPPSGRSARAAKGAKDTPDLAPATGSQMGWMQSKPIPDLPEESPDRPDLLQYGAPGTAIMSGIITSDEHNPDLLTPMDRAAVYDIMRLNHGPVKALLTAIQQPLVRAEWAIEAAGGETDDEVQRNIEIAAFVDSCLFDDMVYQTTEGATLRQSWDDLLRHILLMYPFGFSCFELCFRIDEGWTKWSHWIPLLPRTIFRWWAGADSELAGIQQWTYRNWRWEFVDIPAAKLLLFSRDREGANYEGISMLRAAYKHYMYAEGFEKVEAIAVERQSVVPPVIRLPEGFSASDAAAAQIIVRNIRANDQLGVTLPPGWDFEYPRNQARYAAQTLPAIQYHNTQILASCLLDWLGLGEGSNTTGSYALAEVRVRMVEQIIQADAKLIEQVINTAIRQLVDFNFEGVSVYPQIKCSKISMADITMYAQALQQLAQAQLIHPSDVLEDALLDALGLPKGNPNPIQSQDGQGQSDQSGDQSDNQDQQDQPDGGTQDTQQSGQGNEERQTNDAQLTRNAMGGPPDLASSGQVLSQTLAEPTNTPSSNIMVALPVPLSAANTLFAACKNGIKAKLGPGADHLPLDYVRPEQMHLTLALLDGHTGDGTWAPARQEQLRQIVSWWASEQAPLILHAHGVRRFHNGDDQDAIYAPVDLAPALLALRTDLVATLGRYGMPIVQRFPQYVPHITLSTVPADVAVPDFENTDLGILFDTVEVVCDHTTALYPLGQGTPGAPIGDPDTAEPGRDNTAGLGDVALAEAVLSAIRDVDVVERGLMFADEGSVDARGHLHRAKGTPGAGQFGHTDSAEHAPHVRVGVHEPDAASHAGGRPHGDAVSRPWVSATGIRGDLLHNTSVPTARGSFVIRPGRGGSGVVGSNLLHHVGNVSEFHPDQIHAMEDKLAAFGYHHEDAVRRLGEILHVAEHPRAQVPAGENPDPVGIYAQANGWYHTARAEAERLASAHHTTVEQAAGALAAVSPGVAWDAKIGGRTRYPNIEGAEAALRWGRSSDPVHITAADYAKATSSPNATRTMTLEEREQFQALVGKTLPANEVPAHVLARLADVNTLPGGAGKLQIAPLMLSHAIVIARIAQSAGTTPEQGATREMMGTLDRRLTGAKRRSFYDNIIAPGKTDAVTVDTWMARALAGQPNMSRDAGSKFISGHSTKGLADIGNYPALAHAVQEATRLHDRGLTPDAAQAIIWSWWRLKYPGSNSARATQETPEDEGGEQ